MRAASRLRFCAAATVLVAITGAAQPAAKNAYFGDLHVHTRYSFDAYLFGTLGTPDDAYRFAKGEAIAHPSGFEMRLDRPLDFYAVTDHAFYLGMFSAWADPAHPDADNEAVKPCVQASTPEERGAAFRGCFDVLAELGREEDSRTAWQAIQDAAERHNDPGAFTTFIAYEYTSSRDGNLHRNVFYRGSKAPPLPFSRLDSLNPEDLWAWMDRYREQGMDAIAIPHNANGSNGNMFDSVKFAGEPLDAAYAAQRMRNEPLVEITQVKGTSDTHPFLSPNDEWADFEIYPYQIASWNRSRPQGSYVREAWLNGLALERSAGFNPYRFGIVGASDTHNLGERFDEDKFAGKVGVLDGTPSRRGSVQVSEDGHRASPACGHRRIPATPSSTPFGARRPSAPLGRAFACDFWPATTSTTLRWTRRIHWRKRAPTPWCRAAISPWRRMPAHPRCSPGPRRTRKAHGCSACRSSRVGWPMAARRSACTTWPVRTAWRWMPKRTAARTTAPR